ncbi:MAG: hypothetical protein MK108_15675 [Mariniblastus sp.]|nr:hypothetical protein [Mariniblastus sp.]
MNLEKMIIWSISLLFCCFIGCGGNQDPVADPNYPHKTEWSEFVEANRRGNKEGQVEALQKILAKDERAKTPTGSNTIKKLLDTKLDPDEDE